jgi:hypothetical protein
MNPANLQLEGVLMALYALLNVSKSKGLLNAQEIEEALEAAEANILADHARVSDLRDAQLAGSLFPIRFLRHANTASKSMESFTTIAQLVGETKPDAMDRGGEQVSR